MDGKGGNGGFLVSMQNDKVQITRQQAYQMRSVHIQGLNGWSDILKSPSRILSRRKLDQLKKELSAAGVAWDSLPTMLELDGVLGHGDD